MTKTKFKPDYTYKQGTYIMLPSHPVQEGNRALPFVGQVLHYNVYNRENIRYLCKCLRTKAYFEFDKIYVESVAKVVDKKIGMLLYCDDV